MAIAGWIIDNSAAGRAGDPSISAQLRELPGDLYVCPVGELEQLHSALSATDYDERKAALRGHFEIAPAPGDVLDRALRLQRDLAHHHGMWHRVPIPDLLVAETAIYHGLGVVHVDSDYDRIAEVRRLLVRRLRTPDRRR